MSQLIHVIRKDPGSGKKDGYVDPYGTLPLFNNTYFHILSHTI